MKKGIINLLCSMLLFMTAPLNAFAEDITDEAVPEAIPIPEGNDVFLWIVTAVLVIVILSGIGLILVNKKDKE